MGGVGIAICTPPLGMSLANFTYNPKRLELAANEVQPSLGGYFDILRQPHKQ